MMKTRREILVHASQASLAYLFLNTWGGKVLAQNAQTPRRLFIHMRADGGMHPPMGLDPQLTEELKKRRLDPIRDGDFYAGYQDSEVVRLQNHLLGVGAQPLVPIVHELAIVNGIMMLPNDPNHDPCNQFMSTGDNSGAAPYFVIQLMQQMNAGELGLGLEGIGQLRGLTEVPTMDLTGADIQILTEDMIQLMAFNAAFRGRRTDMTSLQKQLPQLQARLVKMTQLKTEYAQKLPQELRWLAHLAAGFQADLMSFAFIDSNRGFDSHSNHSTSQPQNQRELFEQFAQAIQFLKETPFENGSTSLYEHTTLMLTSEFARTAHLQVGADDGTDHNPFTNSCLLAGAGIRGGTVVGGSTVIPAARVKNGLSRLQALPYDFSTQKALSYEQMACRLGSKDKVCSGSAPLPNLTDVNYIYPGNVLKTVAQALGLKDGTSYLRQHRSLPVLLKT